MDINGINQGVSSVYTAVATWFFENQIAADLIIGGVVLGSLLYLARHTLRMRRLTHRIRWGVGMKKSKNREAYERGLISFGICDAIEEAVHRGDMTRARADQWYESFASDYNMTELLPRKLTLEQKKERINQRMQRWLLVNVKIPGLHPKDELKVDKTYQPETNVIALPKKGRGKSKYSKAS